MLNVNDKIFCNRDSYNSEGVWTVIEVTPLRYIIKDDSTGQTDRIMHFMVKDVDKDNCSTLFVTMEAHNKLWDARRADCERMIREAKGE